MRLTRVAAAHDELGGIRPRRVSDADDESTPIVDESTPIVGGRGRGAKAVPKRAARAPCAHAEMLECALKRAAFRPRGARADHRSGAEERGDRSRSSARRWPLKELVKLDKHASGVPKISQNAKVVSKARVSSRRAHPGRSSLPTRVKQSCCLFGPEVCCEQRR